MDEWIEPRCEWHPDVKPTPYNTSDGDVIDVCEVCAAEDRMRCPRCGMPFEDVPCCQCGERSCEGATVGNRSACCYCDDATGA